jgi:hypothetical protein
VAAAFRREDLARHHCIAQQVYAAANGATVAPAANFAVADNTAIFLCQKVGSSTIVVFKLTTKKTLLNYFRQ